MAKNLEQLSDAELDQKLTKQRQGNTRSVEQLSDDDLNKKLSLARASTAQPTPEDEGATPASISSYSTAIGHGLLSGYNKAEDIAQRYYGAPIRAGLSEYGKSGFLGGLSAAKKQFGEDPYKAPTSEELVNQVDPNGGGTSKFLQTQAVDFATNPLSVIPVEKAFGLVAPAARGAGKMISEAGAMIKSPLIKAESRVAGALTGIEPQIVENYIKNGKSVDDLIGKYGKNSSEAADAIREQYQTQIRNYKNKANEQISKNLASKGDEIVNVKDAVKKLKDQKAKLDIDTKSGEIKELNDMLAILDKKVDENGDILLSDLHSLKEFFQEAGKSAYIKNGQVFVPGKDAARIAKGAARDFRQALNKSAPEIAEANNKLSLLHNAEEGLNKNLLKPGGPDNALMTAGSQPFSRQRKQLQKYEDITGLPMVQKAEDLATARAFAEPQLLPQDVTGKSATRVGAGLLAGGVIGGTPGAIIGGIATSPLALKYGIKTQQAAGEMASYLGKPIEWVFDPKNQRKVEKILKAGLIKGTTLQPKAGLINEDE